MVLCSLRLCRMTTWELFFLKKVTKHPMVYFFLEHKIMVGKWKIHFNFSWIEISWKIHSEKATQSRKITLKSIFKNCSFSTLFPDISDKISFENLLKLSWVFSVCIDDAISLRNFFISKKTMKNHREINKCIYADINKKNTVDMLGNGTFF